MYNIFSFKIWKFVLLVCFLPAENWISGHTTKPNNPAWVCQRGNKISILLFGQSPAAPVCQRSQGGLKSNQTTSGVLSEAKECKPEQSNNWRIFCIFTRNLWHSLSIWQKKHFSLKNPGFYCILVSHWLPLLTMLVDRVITEIRDFGKLELKSCCSFTAAVHPLINQRLPSLSTPSWQDAVWSEKVPHTSLNVRHHYCVSSAERQWEKSLNLWRGFCI